MTRHLVRITPGMTRHELVAAGRALYRSITDDPRKDHSMTTVHLHARDGADRGYVCDTVCGLPCDTVDTAYRGLDPERVTCAACARDLAQHTSQS